MPIKRINEFPDGDSSLSNDDIFLFMDDPSGSGVTKKISLSAISSTIGGGGGDLASYFNTSLLQGSGISFVYDSGNNTLTINSSGVEGYSTSLPYLELTNTAFVIVPAVLGSGISFTRTPEGNETDPIASGLILARGSDGALYNSVTQVSYNNSTHAIDGAEWNADGWGDLLDTTTRSYDTLRSVLNNQIGTYIVGAELIMHDTINDQYYKFLFSDWGQNNGGSFAYTRTLISNPNPNFFEKIDYGNQTDTFVTNDPDGSGVGITRGNNQGIYNPYQEESWTEEVSPLGTEWNADGWEDLSDLTSRTYTNFYNAVGGALGNNVPGSQLIMRLTGTQIYYAIQFINWTQNNNGGGFSYLKYQINLDELQEGITFADGTVLKSAEGVGRVKSTASNDRRIEEVYGNKTVSVTSTTTNTITSSFSRSGNGNAVWIDSTTTNIDEILDNPGASGVYDYSTIQFSLDNNNWYTWNGSTGYDGNERQYGLNTSSFDHNIGDPVYFRYNTGGEPGVWWDKNSLPGGAANFRGAIIDYHCYTGEGTFIGTIHIVDDDGEENITHSEVSSGSTDSENDDLWHVQNEGTISYRRMDGESKTAKFHWGAKIFYGSEYYD